MNRTLLILSRLFFASSECNLIESISIKNSKIIQWKHFNSPDEGHEVMSNKKFAPKLNIAIVLRKYENRKDGSSFRSIICIKYRFGTNVF